MKLYLLGLCGTFMGGAAQLAAKLGHEVSGCDCAYYEPVAGQLRAAGIRCDQHFDGRVLDSAADLYLIGNVVRRGNPAFEAILAAGRPFASAPQWLADNCLSLHRKVIAVAGTHGKTTVTAMIAHLLHAQGLRPSFLVGGVPGNFACSAQLGDREVMVVEADEYDTALFDKRPKFMHYWADVAVLNNIEFDHADIYADLGAVLGQFALLPRMLKANGTLICNGADEHARSIAAAADWCRSEAFNDPQGWHWVDAGLELRLGASARGAARRLPDGAHNRANALAAVAACEAIGADVPAALAALDSFVLPARRMQVVYDDAVTVIDDFAHHPTAIAAVLETVARRYERRRIVALFDPRSNTMRAGHWQRELPASFAAAERIFVLARDLQWDAAKCLAGTGKRVTASADAGLLLDGILSELQAGDVLVMLSNGNIDDLRAQLQAALSAIAVRRKTGQSAQ